MTVDNAGATITFSGKSRSKPGLYDITLTAFSPLGYELTNASMKVPLELSPPHKSNYAMELLELGISVGASMFGMQNKPKIQSALTKVGIADFGAGKANFDGKVKPAGKANFDGTAKPDGKANFDGTVKADGKVKEDGPKGASSFDDDAPPKFDLEIDNTD